MTMEKSIISNRTYSAITEVEGDLFDAPDGAALIHACNCMGSWGGGIAKIFKIKYPAAFKIYKAHCRKYKEDNDWHDDDFVAEISTNEDLKDRTVKLPEGSALIIPPQEEDYGGKGGMQDSEDQDQQKEHTDGRSKKHWIICLFTSRRYGRNVSNAEIILQNTELAVAQLVELLDELRERELGPRDHELGELRACRFNSGLFGVEWALTRSILEGSGLEITVFVPEEESGLESVTEKGD